MCGIALIVYGVGIDVSSLPTSSVAQAGQEPLFSVDDIRGALQRRGPDSLGSKVVFLHSENLCSAEGHDMLCLSDGDGALKNALQYCDSKCYFISSAGERPCMLDHDVDKPNHVAGLYFIGATLQLRGINSIIQPLVDASGNILVYNGEIFGGIYVSSDSNDAEVLMDSLGKCCSHCSHEHIACNGSHKGQNSVPDLLSTIKGPWALIYWQASSRTVWFGRDALGRRSLLVHWPTSQDPRLLLSSVSPPCSSYKDSDLGEEDGISELNFWEELPCGIYRIQICASKLAPTVVGKVERHDWTDNMLNELIKWERASVQPKPDELNASRLKISTWQNDMQSAQVPYEFWPTQVSNILPSEAVLNALREAVIRRTAVTTMFQAAKHDNIGEGDAPVAVLFSGGLDSMILAALLDSCLDSKYAIDLLNVSFDAGSAPDRISAQAGVRELKRIAPSRRWKLVEIDADLSNLAFETRHVMSLINPAKTYMDLNIGLALWLAAGGNGWLYEERFHSNEDYQRIKYHSEAKILLVGSGADEQCAGYGRHKTKYRNGSWLGLHEEMKLDMQRIWKRNLGRDDRCIADNGKEARFPFLDEDVIRTLLGIPLWEIADLDQPSGKGDKRILREVARLLGLHEAAALPKRAIQFGSRIARESNRKNFGSNRAANQSSAGSRDIYKRANLT
ncbi:Asparagine synthase (glutamine-hydrolyzing) [Bertholletia excelsa]